MPMSRLRFSIAQIMAVVLYLGFGFAALRNANAFWAGATFSVAIVLVAVVLVGACLGTKAGRMPRAAFAAAGGVRLGIWLFLPQNVGGLNGIPWPLLYRSEVQWPAPARALASRPAHQARTLCTRMSFRSLPVTVLASRSSFL